MSAGDRVRLGAVSYLNTRALIHGLDRGPLADRIELQLAVPAELARRMAAGALDVALLPTIALADQPDLQLVPGLSISTYGPSRSVLLLSRRPLEEIRTVALDPESRTSNALVQVLFAEAWKCAPTFVPGGPDLAENLHRVDAAVRIGDKALFEDRPEGLHAFDLGEAWTAATGLPFVFAAWFARPGVVDRELYRALHAARRAGARAIDEIAEAYSWNGRRDPALARDYLRDHIQHRLGAAELDALRRFYRSAARLGLVREAPVPQMALAGWSACHEAAEVRR